MQYLPSLATYQKLLTLKNNTMQIINTVTGRDVSSAYLGLMSGLITPQEFELLAMIRPSQSKCNYTY